jgi:hypothetical protein
LELLSALTSTPTPRHHTRAVVVVVFNLGVDKPRAVNP